MKIEILVEKLREHISLAENSLYCAEKGDEKQSNKYDDSMQEIESYLLEELGIELDSYGEIYKENNGK